jgi:putative ABC transport system permease protein
MQGSAPNAVYVWGRRTALPYRGEKPGRPISFRLSDTAALEVLPGVELVTPRQQIGGYRGGAVITHGEHSGTFQLQGDTHRYGRVMNVVYDAGRFIDPLDDAEGRKVAVIGREVARTLFPDEDALGEWIQVQGVAFRVVGVFHAAVASDDGDRQESTVHVPFQTFRKVFHTGDRVRWFALLADAGTDAGDVDRQVKRTLGRLHGVHPDDTQAMGSYNKAEEFARLQNLFAGIRWMVWVVGIATLASGVIGVSNILLIVVRERTAEIGLRRALGATPSSIVAMIVGEAVVLTGVSGIVGVLTGTVLVELAAMAIGPDNPEYGQPGVDVSVVLVAALVLVVAGALAGLLPARRALAVEPVTALRTE